MKTNKRNIRLPFHLKPLRYKLKLKPDLESFTFDGEEFISLRLNKTTDKMTLHSKELDIETAEIMCGGKKIFAQKISYDEKEETATFVFPQKLPKGEIILRLVFRGLLNDKMHGFYRSRYEVNGETRYLATTQFEATDARRAFPCFDEPAMKAVFEVSLVVPKNSVAISNTIPVEILEHGGEYKTVNFLPTPRMSTYLLAFIVGDFELIEKKTKEGVLVRIFTTPGKKHQAEFALNCAAKTLSFFTKYFAIPYPLPVLDLIAAPDFASGAMENWGAITFRESTLLVDPEQSSTANKQWVALVIAHEIAHQWFGNLVTMEWWTHLWLNEGFASYIEYLAVDHIFPEWDIWTQFVYRELGTAMALDGLKTTHPIEVDVRHPDEIGEIFDAISYSKGASVIRMLADYLGEKDFRDGLRHYLKKHSYANATTDHLWKSFREVSGKPVDEIMKNWTKMGGYPLIEIKETKNGFALGQRRFFSSPLSEKTAKDKTVWNTPISFIGNASKSKKRFLLKNKTADLRLKNVRWLKLNADEAGIFATRYPENIFGELKKMVKTKKLSVRDRLGLIRDHAALSGAGKFPATELLSLAAQYKKETDYTVWLEIASALNKIKILTADEPFAGKYDAFAKNIFRFIAGKTGWRKKPAEQHTQTLMRSLTLSNFGFYGDKKTIKRAQKLFKDIRGAKNNIHADLRSVVYGLAAQSGGPREYEKLIEMYKKAALHEEKNRIGAALGNFGDKKLLEKTLVFSLSPRVRAQDTMGIIGAVWRNPKGKHMAWNFVKENWKTFLERYAGGHYLSRLLEPAGSFASSRDAEDIEKFFAKNPAPGAVRAIEQVLEKIYANAAWLSRERKNLEKYFRTD